jgi:hypothetical protein
MRSSVLRTDGETESLPHCRLKPALRNMVVTAVQQVRRMRGGAQSHLMLCAEGGGVERYWVVKFTNNPQHVKVLANDYLATKLAERVGVPVPEVAAVEVSSWLVDRDQELRHKFPGREEKCSVGLQFGARFVVDPYEGQVYDYLPEDFYPRVKNLGDFWGMLCVDKWTCNCNGRQAVFHRKNRERRYQVSFIDQGYCFNAGEWNFPDAPLRGIYSRNAVYAKVTGWESFEPWLSRIQAMPIEEIWKLAESMPPEWYEWDDEGLERLVTTLWKRRGKVADLIHEFRMSMRDPFPEWTKASGAVG